ncbi:MAG: hypothetical protein HQL50_13355, partial [Magnetococcales bacterium]|nr:hypothetical protein [Magnetococcales bacterium]
MTHRAVEELLNALSRKENIKHQTDRLKRWGRRAVPFLLSALAAEAPRPRKTLVFYALQYCWKEEAIDSVVPYLSSDDAEL